MTCEHKKAIGNMHVRFCILDGLGISKMMCIDFKLPCHPRLLIQNLSVCMICVGDTLMAARSRPNDDWGSLGNCAKSRRKARKCWLWYV